MKTATKPTKASSAKPNRTSGLANQPKSNLKAAFGKYKGVIIEKDNCWDEDLKKTIAD